MTRYAELQVTTNFSFLRGASHPSELFTTAAQLGLSALGIVDHSSFAGIIRAWEASKATGVRLVVGCRLDLTDGMSVLVYPTDRKAYARLCQLLTRGKRRAGKGACQLSFNDLAAHSDGVLAILLSDPMYPRAHEQVEPRKRLEQLSSCFGDRAYLAMTYVSNGSQAVTLAWLDQLAREVGVATVVTGDVLYHDPSRRPLRDILSCIRKKCTIAELGYDAEVNSERIPKSPEEMARLLVSYPDAVERSLEIVERCQFDLGELRYQYPNEVRNSGLTPQQSLEKLTWEGAVWRYGDVIPGDVTAQLRHELKLIAELEYAPYFLTVHSIVSYARSKDILCQGRGSAANSTVCFVLGITSIDPVRNSLLFERFISAERREPPDIDVDFEHQRREEVIQWIYETYGRDRAALCATVTRYRTRGAIRDVGKAMGLSADIVEALAKRSRGWSTEGISDDQLKELKLNPRDRKLRWTLDLTQQILGFPRHLGQHPGGFVLTQDRLDELVPVEPARMKDRQVIEWDKDDIDCLKFMKVDVLGLGMLGCMRRAFDLLADHRGERLNLATIPSEDPTTYRMIQQADTIGTFQIESRAQMSMLPRLKPKTFYDLVIEVAIVRPGPIQGDMVHPYLRRRDGLEPVHFPTPELKGVLGKTLGVPLFQEQAMKVAIVCAGFSAGEADQLRRSMATFKFTGGVSHLKDKMINGMVERGYRREFAEKTFSQIEGFGSYGFPESHAASFALIAYASCWMKCHHPDVFCAALLNAQPMGFYAPTQIVRDAAAHGVEIRPISVNESRWDCTLEPTNGQYLAVRLGFRMVKKLPNQHAATIIESRADLPFVSPEELWRRTGVPAPSLKLLADADAFRCLGVGRRQAGWAVRGFRDVQMPLFEAADRAGGLAPEMIEPQVQLPATTKGHDVVEDYRRVGLTLRQHPLAFLRGEFAAARMITCADLLNTKDGRRVTVPGLVLVRQRPGTAKGVMFMTIEDETGNANLIIWPSVFEKQRQVILSAGMVACRGRVQREGIVIHVVAEEVTDLTGMLSTLTKRGDPFPLRPGRADEAAYGVGLDPRELLGREPREIYDQERDKKGTIRVQTRDFR